MHHAVVFSPSSVKFDRLIDSVLESYSMSDIRSEKLTIESVPVLTLMEASVGKVDITFSPVVTKTIEIL